MLGEGVSSLAGDERFARHRGRQRLLRPHLESNADTHLELSGFEAEKVFEVEGTFEDMLEHRTPTDKSRQANEFLRRYSGKYIVILELGIGKHNRFIKQPLMQLATHEPHAVYITLNLTPELYISDAIAHKSVGLAGDIAVTLNTVLGIEVREDSTELRIRNH